MRVMLAIEGLVKTFDAVVAVAGIDLAVAEGEFVSLLGPSGCGKTTVLRCVAGFETPDRGRILLDGVDVGRLPPERRDVGMVFQSYALFPNMDVAGNIAFPLMLRGVPREGRRRRVAELLELVRLPGLEHRRVHELSGGQKQRVALARALAKEPRLLLLDEPLSALDAKIREELRVEIRRIQKELGITALYVTHDQEEALAISDRVVVMNHGRIEQVGTPVDIYRRPRTLFVAGFVGTMNFFEGEFADGALRWRDRVLRVAAEGGIAGRAVLALRPEELRAVRGTAEVPEGWNVLEGRTGPATFLGSSVRLRVDLARDHAVDVDLPAREAAAFTMGERVLLCFPPTAGVLLPAGEEGAGGSGPVPAGTGAAAGREDRREEEGRP